MIMITKSSLMKTSDVWISDAWITSINTVTSFGMNVDGINVPNKTIYF